MKSVILPVNPRFFLQTQQWFFLGLANNDKNYDTYVSASDLFQNQEMLFIAGNYFCMHL